MPDISETVKGYAAHESSTLQNVTDARAGLTKAYNDAQAITPEQAQANIEAYQQAQSNLKGALDIYVNAVREAYPDLKANENFLNLQAQLEGTENRVSTERQRYNEAVEVYNRKVLRFPGNIFAKLFGFDSKDMFKDARICLAEHGFVKALAETFCGFGYFLFNFVVYFGNLLFDEHVGAVAFLRVAVVDEGIVEGIDVT